MSLYRKNGGSIMCKEVLEMASRMGFKEVETQLVLHCSPFIIGLRISSLLIISNNNYANMVAILNQTNISYKLLMINREKTVVFLYNEEKLKEYMIKEKVKRLMEGFGYNEKSLFHILERFQSRYISYVEGSKEFPHEMGLLLGYPVEDVEGFISNNGENFLYSGYWKVYGNLNEKLRLFKKFEIARDNIMVLVSNGINIRDIINIYNQKERRKISF